MERLGSDDVRSIMLFALLSMVILPVLPNRDFGPDDIPWEDLAFTTAESALRDWIAGLPGRGPRHVPELYVEGDPA